jgi:hypothetical protein
LGGWLQNIEMKIIKAAFLILLAVTTVTSCNGIASTNKASSTQVMETAISLAWTKVSITQLAIPIKTFTPTNEESPLINPTTTPILTKSAWTYKYIATVPNASASNSTQEEIASLLFTQWLNHFKTEEADLDHRLEDFELISVVIYEKELPDDFVAMISFSVKPTRMSSWVAGNGISTDNVWVRKKLLFISVKKEKDTYNLVSMGTVH